MKDLKLWGPVILVVLASLVAAISSQRNVERLEKLNEALDIQYKEQQETATHWKNRYSQLNERLAQQAALTASDEAVLEWAYSNASPFVPKSEIASIIIESKKYKNYLMLLAVFKEESGFNRYARSVKQAKGLGQIITKHDGPKWSGWLKKLQEEGIFAEEIDVFDPNKNIAATDYILNFYYNSTGSWKETLKKYVNGDSAYVTRVLSNFAELTLLVAEVDNARDSAVYKTSGRHRDGESVAADASTS